MPEITPTGSAQTLIQQGVQRLERSAEKIAAGDENVVRNQVELIQAEREVELGVSLARAEDQIAEELNDIIRPDDERRGRAIDISS